MTAPAGPTGAIPPDDKDWTWVLERACPECGFDGATVPFESVPTMVRVQASRWSGVLQRADVAVRHRPDRWSDLEYACHVRDVFRIFDRRLALMLAEDEPHFANWDQDETAVADRYGEQDPSVVAAELTDAAERIATSFATVTADQRPRAGVRSDGARFSVETFARYLVHDPEHHLWDVGA